MNEKNQKVIGVLTSGGDAPGMNAAVRSRGQNRHQKKHAPSWASAGAITA